MHPLHPYLRIHGIVHLLKSHREHSYNSKLQITHMQTKIVNQLDLYYFSAQLKELWQLLTDWPHTLWVLYHRKNRPREKKSPSSRVAMSQWNKIKIFNQKSAKCHANVGMQLKSVHFKKTVVRSSFLSKVVWRKSASKESQAFKSVHFKKTDARSSFLSKLR